MENGGAGGVSWVDWACHVQLQSTGLEMLLALAATPLLLEDPPEAFLTEADAS